jgi:hypothetical protein
MKREGHKFYWLYIKQKVLYKIFDNKLPLSEVVQRTLEDLDPMG